MSSACCYITFALGKRTLIVENASILYETDLDVQERVAETGISVAAVAGKTKIERQEDLCCS